MCFGGGGSIVQPAAPAPTLEETEAKIPRKKKVRPVDNTKSTVFTGPQGVGQENVIKRGLLGGGFS